MLNKVPKSVQPNMKTDLREIRDAPDQASAEVAIAVFQEKYGVKYPKAVHCVMKDRNPLLAFFNFPAEHWDHLRTAKPIERTFASVRHRTVRSKGALSQKSASRMVLKLVMAAAGTWRRLKGENRSPMVIAGVKFTAGVAATATADQRAVWSAPLPNFDHSSRREDADRSFSTSRSMRMRSRSGFNRAI